MEECIKVKLIDEFGKLTPHFKEKFGHERLIFKINKRTLQKG